ncbi:MAG: selenide, water dikinase SelD [Treponema sp.]|nr:selenide, water dikinase SelD [Treponema sp.]
MKPDADPNTIQLTSFAKAAGCAAKLSPKVLSQLLSKLPPNTDKALIVGTETSDDAAVYKLTEDIAIVQTVDFFPPVVDSPYVYGQIAATNAISDVYAMGGEPLTALNITAFPSCLGPAVLGEILRGGADKVHEAGASIVGGHSINSEEPIYGLAVTGIIHPQKIRKNQGARPGDILILTKPIGTGLVNTAVKAQMAEPESAQQAIASMSTLNRAAKRVFDNYEIHACTDITGFSLAGHCREMATASSVSIEIDAAKLPLLPEVATYAAQGLVPQGTYRNREFVGNDITFASDNSILSDIIFDPQTSGGLLVSVDEKDVQNILRDLGTYNKTGIGTPFAVIGRVTAYDGISIHIIGDIA